MKTNQKALALCALLALPLGVATAGDQCSGTCPSTKATSGSEAVVLVAATEAKTIQLKVTGMT
ncbi:MAG: hypothetical protein ACSHX0_13905 [Akkermansiaceae bacterium]